MSKSNYYKERVIQLLLFFAFMFPIGAWAQNIQLTGTVTDATGETVIGEMCIRDRPKVFCTFSLSKRICTPLKLASYGVMQ